MGLGTLRRHRAALQGTLLEPNEKPVKPTAPKEPPKPSKPAKKDKANEKE